MEKVGFSGFDWDDGNRAKCQKHGLTLAEIEYVVAEQETLIVPIRPGSGEPRLIAVGKTPAGRYAFVVFTPREHESSGRVLRPISARYMHKRELKRYEQEIAGLQKR